MFRKSLQGGDYVDGQPGYISRTYNLVATVPTPIPPGRSFMVVSADGDADALYIAVGDESANYAYWPPGVTLQFDAPAKARIVSTVSQTVTLLISIGTVSLVNDAPPVYDNSGVVGYGDARTGPLAVTNIVAAALNVRGIIVYQADIFMVPVAGSLGVVVIDANRAAPLSLTTILIGIVPDTGVACGAPFTTKAPWRIGPGFALRFSGTVPPTAPWSISVCYKVL